jgi:hypothetical protein
MNNQQAIYAMKLLNDSKAYMVATRRQSGDRWTVYDEHRNPISSFSATVIDDMVKVDILKKVVTKQGEKRLVICRSGIRKLHGKSAVRKAYITLNQKQHEYNT